MVTYQTILEWAVLLTVYLLCTALIAFVGYCLYVRHIHKKYDHIPGPPRDNHIPTFLRETNSERVVHDKFLERAETYGPVYRINSFHGVALVVSCPEATKEFLMSPKYSKDLFVYKRLFSLFGRSYLQGLMGTFNERAECLMERLEEIAEKRMTANIRHLVNVCCVTLDVICKVAFGVDVDLLKNYNSPFPSAIELCLQGMVHYVRDPFFTLFPRNKKKVQEIKDAVELLRTTGSQWIHQRKSAVENGDDVPKDVLTQMLKTAGQETTANQLSFAIMELGKHPKILKRAKEEVDEVLGTKQEILFDDLGKLTNFSQVLKETLRLYPTAPGTSRWLHDGTVISVCAVPAGCELIMEAKVVLAKILQRFEFSLVPGQSFNIKDTGTLRPQSGVLCKIKHCSQGKN
ncbi:LOW QUALITY PROTEIN: cholesterol 24-hydroxylase-like [Colossoma macropomum]|uniref:LOW QUALITY PROTEIN: cholesterol 24-hydroxylase-like n=1 Tax=Colossoma macropomum TaxID=42526 RepID=UPI0018648631|nr:LOW QUALITY PROTEIN: cholesterol 24-hydroxylase-like [Colossoma macropomum]